MQFRRSPRTSLSRLASQSCARGARSTASRAKRIFGRARARARTLATATRCAARGLSRGGRAPYLGEGAARARRDDVNPVVFGVARERLRAGTLWRRRGRGRGAVRRSGCRPCPRPGLRCWAPAPPGRCSRSSRRAPRSCGCSRPSPWSSAPRLRRRRPPPQIVLRSAIFLIRKGASRPPAGSAARARPRRARGPWGTQYYGVPTRWRRLGPVNTLVNARRAAEGNGTTAH